MLISLSGQRVNEVEIKRVSGKLRAIQSFKLCKRVDKPFTSMIFFVNLQMLNFLNGQENWCLFSSSGWWIDNGKSMTSCICCSFNHSTVRSD